MLNYFLEAGDIFMVIMDLGIDSLFTLYWISSLKF